MSLTVFAASNLARVVYRVPCIVPDGASPNGIGPMGFAGSEKISLYFPLSP
jgi:hypothetical protein